MDIFDMKLFRNAEYIMKVKYFCINKVEAMGFWKQLPFCLASTSDICICAPKLTKHINMWSNQYPQCAAITVNDTNSRLQKFKLSRQSVSSPYQRSNPFQPQEVFTFIFYLKFRCSPIPAITNFCIPCFNNRYPMNFTIV